MIVIKEPVQNGDKVECGWALNTDPMNYILVRIGIGIKEGTKNFGEWSYRSESFHSNLDSLIRAMMNKNLMETEIGKSVEALRDQMNAFHKDIKMALAKNMVLNKV